MYIFNISGFIYALLPASGVKTCTPRDIHPRRVECSYDDDAKMEWSTASPGIFLLKRHYIHDGSNVSPSTSDRL